MSMFDPYQNDDCKFPVMPESERPPIILNYGRQIPFSPKKMKELGWTRINEHQMEHVGGWYLRHCGHPTANFPWVLYDPEGNMVLSGVAYGNPRWGYAWRTVREAVTWLHWWFGLG